MEHLWQERMHSHLLVKRVDYGMDEEDLTLEQRFQLNFDLRDEESHAYYKIN